MDQHEEWRPVVGWPDYEVSSEGQIRSAHNWRGKTGRLLVGYRNPNGYRCVILCGPAGKTRRSVHRIVAEAFHGPMPEGLQTRHLDSNQLNNSARNLRYGTAAENAADKLNNRTHCPNGHLYDENNSRVEPTGWRECRPCRRATVRRYRINRALRAASVPSERAA